MQACLRGDGSAWERLLNRYRRLIFSIPLALGLDRDTAEEVFQCVAVKLYEHLDRLRRTEGLTAWIVTVTRRESHSARRAARRWEPIGEPRDTDAAVPADATRAVHRVRCEHTLQLAFERLGEPCHALLAALYLEDPAPSYETLSTRLGRPVGSLGPTRARCLGKLRKLYTRLGGEPP